MAADDQTRARAGLATLTPGEVAEVAMTMLRYPGKQRARLSAVFVTAENQTREWIAVEIVAKIDEGADWRGLLRTVAGDAGGTPEEKNAREKRMIDAGQRIG
jgi:hypothetical protein